MLGEHGLKHTWDNISDVYTPAADTGDCGTLACLPESISCSPQMLSWMNDLP
jgi:hypothetical protein